MRGAVVYQINVTVITGIGWGHILEDSDGEARWLRQPGDAVVAWLWASRYLLEGRPASPADRVWVRLTPRPPDHSPGDADYGRCPAHFRGRPFQYLAVWPRLTSVPCPTPTSLGLLPVPWAITSSGRPAGVLNQESLHAEA